MPRARACHHERCYRKNAQTTASNGGVTPVVPSRRGVRRQRCLRHAACRITLPREPVAAGVAPAMRLQRAVHSVMLSVARYPPTRYSSAMSPPMIEEKRWAACYSRRFVKPMLGAAARQSFARR